MNNIWEKTIENWNRLLEIAVGAFREQRNRTATDFVFALKGN